MSTISLPHEKQIKHMIAFVAIDAAITAKTFAETGVSGNAAILGESGEAWAAGQDLLFLRKDMSGRMNASDLVTPKDITYMRGTAPRAKAGKIQTAKVESGIVVGTDYFIDFKLNYGSSEENFMTFLASTRAVTGDTATTLATKLGVELAAQLDRSIHTGYQGSKGKEVMIAGTSVAVNRYFKITQVAGVLSIQEKDYILDNYLVGLRSYDQLNWNIVTKTSLDTFGTASVVLSSTTTAGVYAKGQGYQLKELEHYLGSHTGEYGTADITLGHNKAYFIDQTKSYYTIDLTYGDVSRNDPYVSDKNLLFATESMAEINKIGAAIEAAGGPAWTDFVAPI